MAEDNATSEDEALARAVHAVYGVAPADFVATRKEWVGRLRSDGLREVAKQVGALRKPSASAAAVNALVRADDPVVARLRDVGAKMRHAQSALDARALAGLRDDRDEVLAAWVTAAHEHTGATLTAAVEAEVRDTAVAALADPEASEVVTSGSLTRALSYSGFGEVDVADAVARTSTGVVLTRIEGGRSGEEEADEADVDDVGDEAEDVTADEGDTAPDQMDVAPDERIDGEDVVAAAVVAEGVLDEAVDEPDEDGEEAEDEEPEDEEPEDEDGGDDVETDSDVASLEMDLDEAEKVVAAARAARRTAARQHDAAEQQAATAAAQLEEAEQFLTKARSAFEEAEGEQSRAAQALELAEEELRRSRRQRDHARAALEEAEDQ